MSMMSVKPCLTISLVLFSCLLAVFALDAINVSEIADIFEPSAKAPPPQEPYYSFIKDNGDGTLYIGSSAYVYKVNAATFQEIWSMNINKDVEGRVLPCEATTPDDQEVYLCENQISIVEELVDQNQLLVCGTNAAKPRCWNCNMTKGFDQQPSVCTMYSSDDEIEKYLPSRLDFDYTWFYNKTSGLLYVGTERESSAESLFAKVALDEFFLSNQPSLLTNNPSNENWLNMPAFVGKPVLRGNYVYFFFRETATEYKNAGKIIYSRVGRICADNSVSPPAALRGQFYQTLVKARLNCSIDLEFPFYFNEIQDVYMSGDIIYAVFTTPSEGPPASAVCAFNWLAIENLFDNQAGYKGQATTDSDWLRKSYARLNLNVRPGTCGHRFDSSDEIDAINKYNLIDELVPSIRDVTDPSSDSGASSESPLLYRNGYRFNRIVKVEEGVSENEVILMIGTTDMKILKARFNSSVGPEEYGSIVSEIQLDTETLSPAIPIEVRDMVPYTDNDNGETYVIATAVEKAYKIPVVYCEIYLTCEDCKRVKDPDCVWKNKMCTKRKNSSIDHDPCYLKPQSEKIDIIQSFGGDQHLSKHVPHHVNFYALAIAKKGCNFEHSFEPSDEVEKYWDIAINEGKASNEAEFFAIRFTGNEMETDKARNVTILLNCRNHEDHNANMTVEVIEDSSATAACADKIYEYDVQLAKYEYNLTTIRQEVLRKCHGSPQKQEIYQCPSFTFQDLWR